MESIDLSLYAITLRGNKSKSKFLAEIEEAIVGGVTFVQLREKNFSTDEYNKIARIVKTVTDKYDIPLIINDNVEVAKTIHAAGVHVGEEDMDVKKARDYLGSDYIIGATCKTVERAMLCQTQGADYLGCGDVFGTSSKNDAVPMDMETLSKIVDSVTIPVVAIGGINSGNIDLLKNTGIKGVAVIGGIFSGDNILENAKVLKGKVAEII